MQRSRPPGCEPQVRTEPGAGLLRAAVMSSAKEKLLAQNRQLLENHALLDTRHPTSLICSQPSCQWEGIRHVCAGNYPSKMSTLC